MLIGSKFAHGPPNDIACENLVAAVQVWSIECLRKTILQNSQENTCCRVRISVQLQVKNKTQVNYYGFSKIFKTAFDQGNMK